MRRPVKCDVALLDLLVHSDTEAIDFLVDVLTDEGAGRLALSSSIKDRLLHEKAEGVYTEDGLRNLLHELQEYGGNSLINLFRTAPLAYEELLTDVHKKLNGRGSSKKLASSKEREIVLSLFGEDWATMADHERWSRCTETRVVGGFFQMEDHLTFNDKGVAFALSAVASAAAFAAMRALVPLAVLGVAVQSVSEAYRITIPFVAQVARIRMLSKNA